MSTSTSLLHKEMAMPLPILKRQRPFLEALEHIEYGHLTLITPEGTRLEYSGESASGPVAHLKLNDWQVLDDLISRGEMGLVEAYMDGRWISQNLPDLLTFGLMNHDSLGRFFYGKPWYIAFTYLKQILRVNSLWGSKRNVMAHYDLGNDFYELWLDKSMTYSCALFEGDAGRTLEEAQQAKYRRILRKLEALPGDHVLEIGCGWGGFAEAAAQQGLRVTGITLSEEQANFARARLHAAGLSERASIQLVDYRKVAGEFDHVVSIGMFEHVGERYWRTYFDTIKKHLKRDGKAVIQSITLDDELFESSHNNSGFMEQVIFPGGMLPSRSRFLAVAGQAGFVCQELFAFGKDYARTSQEWLDRFNAKADQVKALGYDEAFLRLWRFYLSACIASFTSNRTSVMQAKLTLS